MRKYLLLIVLAVISFTSCKQNKSDKPIVTVTILPQQYFAQKIAGDKYEIKTMVPKGSSPESFDPTPSQLIDLTQSLAYFRIGEIGFEKAWMKKLALNSPHMVIFDNSHGIQLLESEHECSHGAAADEHIHTAECNHDHDHDHAEEHSHAEIHSHEDGDPHIWTSPRNAKIIASNMLKAFITLDPENEEFFKENYNSLIREIEAVDDSISGMLSSSNGKSFVIYHPSLTYFANDYGLNQISIENLGKEPSAMYLKTLVDSIRTNGTKVFFIQKEFDTKNAEILAREVNGKIVQIDPLNENWSEEMINIAKELK